MRALVLSGGGTRGSWQAGVVRYLSEVTPDGFHFITGTSVGALVAAGLAMYPPSRFPEAAAFVESVWRDRIDESMWGLRFPLGLPGVFRPSFGTRAGMERLVRELLDTRQVQASGVRLRLPAVDLGSGDLIVFDETTADLPEAVLASSAFPVVFPPVEKDGRLLLDGGVRDFAPLKAAIEAGADSIVVVMTENPEQLSTKDPRKLRSALAIAERTLRIMLNELIRNDVHHCNVINRLIDDGRLAPSPGGPRRIDLRVVVPRVPLGSSLDFSPALLRAQIEQGYADAKAALA